MSSGRIQRIESVLNKLKKSCKSDFENSAMDVFEFLIAHSKIKEAKILLGQLNYCFQKHEDIRENDEICIWKSSPYFDLNLYLKPIETNFNKHQYFKGTWNEVDTQYPEGGTSIWLFEISQHNYAIRQVILYDNHVIKKYSLAHQIDEIGGLSTGLFDLEILRDLQVIDSIEFNKTWRMKKTN